MLKPRPLPPAHKNQLFVPIKFLGFFSDDHTPTFFRNHEITKKRFKPKPTGIFAPSLYTQHHGDVDDASDKDMTSPRDSMTSVMHVRGRASMLDVSDVSVNIEATPRKTPTPDSEQAHSSHTETSPFLTEDPSHEHRPSNLINKAPVSPRSFEPRAPKIVTEAPTSSRSHEPGASKGVNEASISSKKHEPEASKVVNETSTNYRSHEPRVSKVINEAPTSSRSFESRSSQVTKGSTSPRSLEPRPTPVLECSKYSIIGEPRFRKKRVKRSEWKLPELPPPRIKGFVESSDAHHPKTNSIDVKSIYGSQSKLNQVPPEGKRENTIILPPLEIGGRRKEAEDGLDSRSKAEKRLVMAYWKRQAMYTRMVRDHVQYPTAYKPYFRFKQRKHQFVRSLFSSEDVWENNRQPVHCSRCIHQSTATLHFCDVLGKRFCRFCSQMTDRAFSQAYEGNRLLVPSPHKSPTLSMMREPSFIGVRKIVITKTAKDVGEEGQGGG